MRGREVRGAPYSAQWESSTHSGSPDVFRELVGFRLVHGITDQVCSGGLWRDDDSLARAGHRGRLAPGNQGGRLGFRLVWGRT